MDNSETNDLKIQEIRKTFSSMDFLFFASKKELKEISALCDKLSSLSEKIKTLEQFYHSGDWIKGREILFDETQDPILFETAGEDAIWDLLADYYDFLNLQKKKIDQSLKTD